MAPRWVELFQRHGKNMDVATEEWITATLDNSWVAFSSTTPTLKYMKDPFGFVHLTGIVKNGSAATATITTLPVGYRPELNLNFAISNNSTYGNLSIASTGVVNMTTAGSTTWVSLEGLTFRVPV